MKRTLKSTVALFLMAFALVACESRISDEAEVTPALSEVTVDSVVVGAETDKDNWTSYGHSYSEKRFGLSTGINTTNVGDLGLAWSLDLEERQSLHGTPLAIDGVLYFTGSRGVAYAVDAKSGELLWRYDSATGKAGAKLLRATFGSNRGAAYWNGKLYFGTDRRLIALDAQTGSEVWVAQAIEDGSSATITSAPRAFNGKVIVGHGGAEFGARGYVNVFDAETGEELWRFYTVPGNPADGFENDAMKMAAETWSGEWWTMGGGGTVWNGITYDPEFNQIYLGVGNSTPYDVNTRSPGGGDNLFLTSIVALDADTGEYKWHYQHNPREAWDWKSTADMVLADLEIDGVQRKVVMQAPSNGFFYVIDRQTGELLSAEAIGHVTWADRIDIETGRPIERPGIRYENDSVDIYPSLYGAHNWQAMSFNPDTGLVYIPYMHLGARFMRSKDAVAAFRNDPYNKRIDFPLTTISIYSFLNDDDDAGTGALLAWDPVTQKARWRVKRDAMWNGGTLTTKGGLVFQGTALGEFAAYSAESGEQLWTFNAGHGITSPPITYTVDGEQYVSVLVGWGGAVAFSPLFNHGWKYGAQPRRILTFKLGGEAKLPPTQPPTFETNFLDDPELQIDDDLAAAGAGIFYNTCVMCHGVMLAPNGAAPDLRESGVAYSKETLHSLLQEGWLVDRGMPLYSDLTEEDSEKLFHYIRKGARDGLMAEKAE